MAKNELVSLALISIQPMHIYAINTLLDMMHLEHWAQVSRASIYATVRRLEKSGMLSVSLEKVDNMPERKVFSLTDAGGERLNLELKEAITSHSTAEEHVLFYIAVALFFGATVSDGLKWAKERVSSIDESIIQIGEQIEELNVATGENESVCILLETAISHLQVEREATQKFIKLLQEKPTYYDDNIVQFREFFNNPEKRDSSDKK
jgi:DNA-binding PadR family transcriptional regulator